MASSEEEEDNMQRIEDNYEKLMCASERQKSYHKKDEVTDGKEMTKTTVDKKVDEKGRMNEESVFNIWE